MTTPWMDIHVHDPMDNGGAYWSLDDLRHVAHVTELIPNQCYIAMAGRAPEPLADTWAEFVVCRWAFSDADGSNAMVEPWWQGCGPTGYLREMRHSWFGEGQFNKDPDTLGYVFYLNGDHMRAALTYLEQFYDLRG